MSPQAAPPGSVEQEEGFEELLSLLRQIRQRGQAQQRLSLKLSAIDCFMALAKFDSINHLILTYHERKPTHDLTFLYRPSRGVCFIDQFLQFTRKRAAEMSEATREEFAKSIVRQAAEIVVGETASVLHGREVAMPPVDSLKLEDLDAGALPILRDSYARLLPLFTNFLSVFMTAPNRMERRRGQTISSRRLLRVDRVCLSFSQRSQR